MFNKISFLYHLSIQFLHTKKLKTFTNEQTLFIITVPCLLFNVFVYANHN